MKGQDIFFLVMLLIVITIIGTMIWSLTPVKIEREKNFLECVDILSRDWCGVGQIPLSIDSERCSKHADINAVKWCYSKFIK